MSFIGVGRHEVPVGGSKSKSGVRSGHVYGRKICVRYIEAAIESHVWRERNESLWREDKKDRSRLGVKGMVGERIV